MRSHFTVEININAQPFYCKYVSKPADSLRNYGRTSDTLFFNELYTYQANFLSLPYVSELRVFLV